MLRINLPENMQGVVAEKMNLIRDRALTRFSVIMKCSKVEKIAKISKE